LDKVKTRDCQDKCLARGKVRSGGKGEMKKTMCTYKKPKSEGVHQHAGLKSSKKYEKKDNTRQNVRETGHGKKGRQNVASLASSYEGQA